MEPECDMSRVLSAIHDFWFFPVYTSGGSKVLLHQLVFAVVILLLGLFLAKRISKTAIRRIGRRVKFRVGLAELMQRILFYMLITLAVLIALPIAGIPITIFTVLGGGLVLGIGFGAQNLINNLISGVILLFEQPVRVGDIVEVDDTIGQVEDIGNRCVRMRRPDGADVLLPNSHFLEHRVVNWSLFDDFIRGRITVGAAYESDPELVRNVLMAAASENTQVQSSPAPIVVFDDFGDNALVFTLYFWCRVQKPIDLLVIQSNLRFAIARAFRERALVIAFPQRDVHLDQKEPLVLEFRKSRDN